MTRSKLRQWLRKVRIRLRQRYVRKIHKLAPDDTAEDIERFLYGDVLKPLGGEMMQDGRTLMVAEIKRQLDAGIGQDDDPVFIYHGGRQDFVPVRSIYARCNGDGTRCFILDTRAR